MTIVFSLFHFPCVDKMVECLQQKDTKDHWTIPGWLHYHSKQMVGQKNKGNNLQIQRVCGRDYFFHGNNYHGDPL